VAEPLLVTKTRIPPLRKNLVIRQRLIQRLDDGIDQGCRLILICAPAGYGKTTLLSQWVSHLYKPVGWLSLNRADNDITQFLRYFLAAIQQIDPKVGAPIPEMLVPPRSLSDRAVWITLINDLAASEKSFTIILDDYQEVEERVVHEALEYLIEHMPNNLHLVLATRADPPMNLAQLRARGHLLEFRAADLCFNLDEAKLFFQAGMGQQLAEKEVNEIFQKAEGWVAGLQIAGIFLQNQPNLPKAVQSFAGSHRHILDYLGAEVIEHLPESWQNFLCQTAILDDLEAGLCDAVTERSDSRQILEQLDRQNQFIVPLDGDRRWYRYHRLMVEALRRRTESLDGKQIAELHRRASAWYEAHGMMEAAIDHAYKAGDLEHAALLVEEGAEAALKRSQIGSLLGWLDRLPAEQFRLHPRLNTIYAWALLFKGSSIQAVRERLEASSILTADSPTSAEQAVIRGMLATYSGNASQGLMEAQRALEDLPSDSVFLRSIALDNLGMAHVLLGDISSAIQAFKESSALARDSNNIMFAVASLSNLGGLYLVQGHLKLAEAVYRQALELAATPYGQRLPVACRALLGLSEISREWNRLEQARGLLEEALQLSQQYNETGELAMVLSLARVQQVMGNGEKALDLAQKAQTIAMQSRATTMDDRLVEVALARLWLQQGSLADAAEWAARRGFGGDSSSEAPPAKATPPVPYDLYEAEMLVHTRLLLAQDKAEAALDTLAGLSAEAEKRGRTRRLHEIHILIAVAHLQTGEIDLAVQALEKSLRQAEAEGYRRVYLDEGSPMVRLLREAARWGIQKPYCRELLSAFQQEGRNLEGASGGGVAGLIEPLSERELEILHLLAAGCTNREIGEQLYISLSTVKGHISNISGKLLAKNRTEAVARARQMGVLPGIDELKS